jgi:hypothetical protein
MRAFVSVAGCFSPNPCFSCANILALFVKLGSLQPGGSPYHTVHPADTSLEGWNFHMLKQNRSNSWSDSLDEIKLLASSNESSAAARLQAEIELTHRFVI